MRVLLAGGSGVLGQQIVAALRADGQEVATLGRGAGNDLRADLLDRDAVLRAVEGLRFDAVVHAATGLSGKKLTRHADMEPTDVLRRLGTPNLIEAARATGARRLVAESMMFGYGYGDHGDRPLVEDVDLFGPPGASPELERHVGAMRVKEQLMLNAEGMEGVALRFGLFYGPGVTDQLVVPMLRKRMLPGIADHGRRLAWTAVPDAARAVVAALHHGRAGQAYNIADDEAVGWTEHLRAIASAYGTPQPMTVPLWLVRPLAPLGSVAMTTNLRLDNGKARTELGWKPTHRDCLASVRAGLGR
ncbi:NAD-dependent epimerase/dehydratase family protein [Streptacidiphilus rugosus]|uniref:NAD-dependent epimerase/dehydratase family protein n=1 Tax=Streptacidiphilus rugosus TaxID=405783 RepID=UPI00056C747A|nr:NAD(P)-dependent oxidoreductase [Streptacidiphilus rugosus]